MFDFFFTRHDIHTTQAASRIVGSERPQATLQHPPVGIQYPWNYSIVLKELPTKELPTQRPGNFVTTSENFQLYEVSPAEYPWD